MTPKPGGTREQEAVAAWLDRMAAVRTRMQTTAEQVPAVLPYFDFLTDATACFGRCEIDARSLDRAVALDVFPERRKPLRASVAELNAAGLQQVEQARRTLKKMAKEIEALDMDPKRVRSRLDTFQREVRVAIADWDMKVSDAEKLDAVVAEAVGHVRKAGLDTLPSYLDRKLAELGKLRRRRDRGAVDNIPWWKIVILAGFLGWMILQWLVCSFFGCSVAVTIFWTVVYVIHLLAFVLFC
jgi:hypothetical protein